MGDSSAATIPEFDQSTDSFLTLSPSVQVAQRPTYHLSPLQRKILGIIQFDAQLSIAEVAKIARSREGSVRYAIQALRDNDIIYRAPLIDLSRLGFSIHSLLFSLNTKDRYKIECVRKFLSSAPQVTFASEIGGKFQFGAAFVAKTPDGIVSFMQSLEDAIGDIILEKQVATHLRGADLRADYICQEKSSIRSIRFGSGGGTDKIDTIDHKILVAISSPDFTSVASIARSIGLPLSTVEFRLRRLEERRIILCYRNLICSGRLGVQRFWMTIVIKGSVNTFSEDFFNYCDTNPFIKYASSSVGGWDFDLAFDAPNGSTGSAIIEDINRAFGERIMNATTVPLFKTARFVAYPFVDHPDTYR